MIRTYVLPEDLLDRGGARRPLALRSHGSLALPEPTHAVASAPYFSLSLPYTQTMLVACRDPPIQLRSALPPAPSSPQPPALVASSPLV